MSDWKSSHLAKVAGITFIALVLALSGGCSSTSKTTPPEPTSQPTPIRLPPTNTPVPTLSKNGPDTVNLQVGGKRTSLTFVQTGNSVPITVVNGRRGTVLLAPESFILQVEGDKRAVSIVALPPADETILSLEQSEQPVVIFNGNGYAFEDNDLRVFGSLEFHNDPEAFFASDLWGASSEQATTTAEYLESKLGAVPILFYSPRAYHDDRDRESGFRIETISGDTPSESEAILLVVFIENPLGGGFQEVEWFTFQVSFIAQ